MKEEIKTFPDQIRQALELSKDIEIDISNLGNIIIDGMGASSISGDIFKNLYSGTIPVYVNKNPQLPSIAGDSTLLISISYSGNTYETISTIEQAIKKEIATLAITSGGKLEKICKKKNIPVCIVPSGIEPRSAAGYLAFMLLGIMGNSGLLPDFRKNCETLIESLENPDMQFNEAASQIAKMIKGKIPVIYSPFNYSSLSYRWKTQFNENSKQPAFAHTFPEIFHNELESFEHNPFPLFAIILIDPDSSKEDQKQIKKFEKILKSKKTPFIKIEMVGDSQLEKIFTSIHLGDWVSYYLGVENNVEIKKVKLIEDFKK